MTRDKMKILERQTEHMKELMNKQTGPINMEEVKKVGNKGYGKVDTCEELQREITWKEVDQALKAYSNGKAQGPGSKQIAADICVEMLSQAKIRKGI